MVMSAREHGPTEPKAIGAYLVEKFLNGKSPFLVDRFSRSILLAALYQLSIRRICSNANNHKILPVSDVKCNNTTFSQHAS